MPRLRLYHPDIAREIVTRMALGETLRSICGPARRKGMPGWVTVHKWLYRYPEFRKGFALARWMLSEQLADEVMDIVDGAPFGLGGEDMRCTRREIGVRRQQVAVLNTPAAWRRGAPADPRPRSGYW